MKPILECIPNFSEGVDENIIESIEAAIRSVKDVYLLHIDKSPAANRTVMTFAGAPEAVVEAAFRAIRTAAELIDMRKQSGVHPRIGATDVCPLVPLSGLSEEQANAYALHLAERVGNELNIPVFLYEYSQPKNYRAALPQIRKGQYEGLASRMQDPEWYPDYGPKEGDLKAGAVVLGVRKILVAFNISLDTKDVAVAESIAKELRSSGYWIGDPGKRSHIPGKFPQLRAIGWYMADYNQAQVSFNLLDYQQTDVLDVWLACREAAAAKGISLAGSELIGLMPESCLEKAGSYADPYAVGNERLQSGVALLGLDRLKPFRIEEKILERVWYQRSGERLKIE
jgi:glutamate formiminotransferase/formiminotetrahydrofolate cyclodeaminase